MQPSDLAQIALVTLTAVACVALLGVGGGRSANRLLALALFLDAAAWHSQVLGVFFPDAASRYAANSLVWVATVAVAPAYLLFLGRALETSVTRPLKRRPVRALLWAITILGPLLVVVRYGALLRTPGAFLSLDVLMGLAYLFGLVAALLAIRESRGNALDRRRAIAFALAFGVRDAMQAPLLIIGPLDLEIPVAVTATAVVGSQVALLGFLTYGILQTQLLGIDLRVKWTLKRGTVVGAFLAAFLVVAELVQSVASDSLGYLAGALTAGLMLFALRPIERAAARVADAAMSRVEDTPEYLHARRQDIYRAALEDSMSDGSITTKERTVLLRLAQNLGLDGNDAMRIEGEVIAARGPR